MDNSGMSKFPEDAGACRCPSGRVATSDVSLWPYWPGRPFRWPLLLVALSSCLWRMARMLCVSVHVNFVKQLLLKI